MQTPSKASERVRDRPQLRQQALERGAVRADEPRRLHASAPVDRRLLPIEDRWILSRLATTTAAVTEQLDKFRFSETARTIYDFTWSEFCDWYLEMAKSRGSEDDRRPVPSAQRMLVGVLDAILRLLHPIMPFVTESIWQALAETAFERGLPNPQPSAESVMIAPWPSFPVDVPQPRRWNGESARMQELVRAIRNIRNQFMVNEKATVDVFVRCDEPIAKDFESLKSFIQPLAKVGKLECGPTASKPPQAAHRRSNGLRSLRRPRRPDRRRRRDQTPGETKGGKRRRRYKAFAPNWATRVLSRG